MKVILAILVYDRYNNLKHWLDCWQKCDKDAELVVIHNKDYRDWFAENNWIDLVEEHNVEYRMRENIGYDIGALQDISQQRIKLDYDRLLWVTDDVFPMRKDFVKSFLNAFKENTGVVAMEISPHVKPHIRTSGFMISREVLERIDFLADPITTKKQCYEFEHLSDNAFYEQVVGMGKKVVQVADKKFCPLWDSGYSRKLNRKAEHELIFGKMPKQPAYVGKNNYL